MKCVRWKSNPSAEKVNDSLFVLFHDVQCSEQDVCCDAEEKEKMLHTCKTSSSGMFELCGISSTVLQLIVALTCSDFTPSFPRIFVQRCLHTVHCVFFNSQINHFYVKLVALNVFFFLCFCRYFMREYESFGKQ